MDISEAHAAQLTGDGYTIVEGFLSGDEVSATLESLGPVAPSWDQLMFDEDPGAASRIPAVREFPDFPSRVQHNVVRPDLLRFVEGVIGTDDLRLSVSFLWVRYAGMDWREQELHSDVMNQTLVYPRNDGVYRQVEGALYYTDVTEELSPTAVLSTKVDELRPGGPVFRPRAEYPGHYDREVKVTVPAGSLLLYGLTTLHRGGAFTATEGRRISHHFAFRSGTVDWGQWRGWARHGADPELATFLTGATPRQRHLFGFPLPGDPYWTPEMVAGVGARYPSMDLSPYADALRG